MARSADHGSPTSFGRRLAHGALLVAYLVSSSPASASLIYCISDEGHAGIELVGPGDRGCSSCCHDEVKAEASALSPQAIGDHPACTDVLLGDTGAVSAKHVPCADGDDLAVLPWPLPAVAGRQRSTAVAVDSSRAPPDLPLLRSVVLLL